MRRVLAFTLIFVMILSLCACSEKGTINMKHGESTNITLSKSYEQLEWESTNNEVATVTNGKVTATGPGQASIIAKSNSKVVAQYETKVSIVEITNVFLSTDSIELKIDETAKLTYSLFPQDASDYGITYTSINPDIATVDDDGMIYGICSGKTNIVLSTKSGITVACEVTVKEPSAIEQLNEDEKLFFDMLVERVLPSFYNAPAARVKKLGPTLGDEDTSNDCLLLDVRMQGTNKLGGTLFKDYLLICNRDKEKSTYLPCFTSDGLFQTPHEWYESTKIDIEKVNLALEEYWNNSGMKQ